MAIARFRLVACVTLFILLAAAPSSAQQENPLASLDWQVGPTKGDLGGIATIDVPDGYRFVGPADARKFMELTENIPDGHEQGVLLRAGDSGWFVVFTFSADGYIDDKDRELDADGLISSIRQGTEEGNKTRRERGWSTMEILGWQQAPFYDTVTNNLTWSIKASSSDGGMVVNHSTRLLGRRGVMNVDLVLSPDQLPSAVPAFNEMLTGFSYSAGQRYAEFTKGDKVAQYGLAGLIAGGAGVALVKSGILAKFWKVIVFGFVALLGLIKKVFSGRGRSEAPAES